MDSHQYEFDINDVRRYIISRTLADRPVRYGQALFVDMALEMVAHKFDVKETDLRVEHHGMGNLNGDPISWWVKIDTTVECYECEYPAAEWSEYTPPLCDMHLTEARAQDHADDQNDDIAIGLQ
jgi:hypothetical protein